MKIDAYYEAPIQMLGEGRDGLGNHLMIRSKHQGGLGEFRDYIRCRDSVRELIVTKQH